MKVSVVALCILVICIDASTCGVNCPTNTCPTCPCGNTAYPLDVAKACQSYSWSQSCCKCIAEIASGGNSYAMHYAGGSMNVGFLQINSANWASCNNGNAPCVLNANLVCAEMIYKWGNNTWALWGATASTCGCLHSH